MRTGAILRWIGVAALFLGASETATAQPSGGVQADAQAQVGFERRPQLSPQDELNQADSIISRMEQAASTVRRQLDTARVARDVVKSLCLSDKLSQIDVATRSARDRQAALQAAVQRNDTELANHEFTILTVLRQRAEQLSAEANQCIGEEVAFIGATQVTSTYDPNLPGETTEFPPLDQTFVSTPPPPVTPRM
jgi:hypothetical protein